jgi:alanine-glyoxylate transaminase/serine-glyoxylate transaminase/serine-pyruvate transaminase
MVLSERVLMGPGPCNPYPEATAGLTRPVLGHLDPEFISVLDQTCERLRSLWATTNPVTMGHTARMRNVTLVLAALAEILGR